MNDDAYPKPYPSLAKASILMARMLGMKAPPKKPKRKPR